MANNTFTQRAADHIKNNIDLIAQHDFNNLYQSLIKSGSFFVVGQVSEMTRILIDSGINPLLYLTYVPNGYCYKNEKIDYVRIPGHIRKIEGNSFTGCKSLVKVDVDSGPTMLDYQAFLGCRSLKTVNLPVSIQVVQREVFANCDSLTNINYAGTLSQWSKVRFVAGWNENSKIKTVTCSDGVREY